MELEFYKLYKAEKPAMSSLPTTLPEADKSTFNYLLGYVSPMTLFLK
jgi:hypothetical protein